MQHLSGILGRVKVQWCNDPHVTSLPSCSAWRIHVFVLALDWFYCGKSQQNAKSIDRGCCGFSGVIIQQRFTAKLNQSKVCNRYPWMGVSACWRVQLRFQQYNWGLMFPSFSHHFHLCFSFSRPEIHLVRSRMLNSQHQPWKSGR